MMASSGLDTVQGLLHLCTSPATPSAPRTTTTTVQMAINYSLPYSQPKILSIQTSIAFKLLKLTNNYMHLKVTLTSSKIDRNVLLHAVHTSHKNLLSTLHRNWVMSTMAIKRRLLLCEDP